MMHIELDRIPPITDERLTELNARIRPLVTGPAGLHFLKRPTKDLRGQSYLWDARPGVPAPVAVNMPYVTLITYHTYGAPSLFKPSIAEVLAQVDAALTPEQLAPVVGYWIDNSNLDATHVLSDGYHFVRTVLFTDWRQNG